jgi:hypothetical protein
METAIALFCAWAIITVIGHGSWFVVRGFFRLFTDSDDQHRPVYPASDEKADIAASRRVINRMVRDEILDPATASDLHQQLRKLEFGEFVGEPSQRAGAATSGAATTASGSVEEVQQAPLTAPAADAQQLALDDQPDDQPIMASLAAPPPQVLPSSVNSSAPSTEFSEPPPQPRSVLSRSEVIQSFLAAHNIRWGELAAGMLIVGCSIGLVITLWNTLVDTHRVIPSLIFLCANAAIYAAGLYTLSRWRLRHTSRAVLVIATLLVPLSVLAGLAAAGTGADAVQLGDPITLAAVALASLIYISLLYRGGKALAGRAYAAPIALAVAGPVSILPFVPASVRVFESSAGWIVAIGSLAVLVSSVWQLRLHAGRSGSFGPAVARNQLWVMGFAGFSLAMSIGYAAFAVRGFGAEGMLPIAIAVLPALVALSSSARGLMKSARVETHSMTGAVLCAILIGMAWMVMPPSMLSPSWLWSWAIVFAVSAFGVGWLAGQPRWLALATLPAGVATTISSPVWLGGHSWETVALWQRFFGGEPMLAASLVTLVVGVASRFISEPPSRRAMGYAGIFWALVAVAIAAGLSVAPLDALSMAPGWSVTCVLVAGVIVSMFLSARHHAWSWATIGATVFAWLSVFRPIQFASLQLESAQVWMTTLLAISATLLVLCELAPRYVAQGRQQRRIMKRSTRSWLIASAIAAIFACVFASPSVGADWTTAAITLGCSSILLFWGSTISRSVDVLRVSQLATIALLVVIGYGRFESSLFTASAWSTGAAPWAWALVAGFAAALWIMIRHAATSELAPLPTRGVRRRLRHLSSREASMVLMPDGWAGAIATGMVGLGSLWALAALFSQVAGNDIVTYEFPFVLPAVALLVCGIVSRWVARHQDELPIGGKWEASLVIVTILWAACQLAHVLPGDAPVTLVVATTLAVIACLALPRWGLSRLDRTLSDEVNKLSIIAAPSLVVLSSTVLLLFGWWDPIVDRTYAHALETIAVAAWWMIAAAGLLWISRKRRDGSAAIASAVLFPVAAMLIVPVFSLAHPAVWIQVGATVSIAWVAITRYWFDDDQEAAAGRAIDGSMWFAITVGIVTSGLVTISIAFNISPLQDVIGPAGLIISVLSVVLWSLGWVRLPNQGDTVDNRLPWPLAVSMLAGQVAWLADATGLATRIVVVELIPAIWVLASLASLAAYRVRRKQVDFLHIGLVSVATVILAFVVWQRSELIPWLALAALATAGLLVALVGSGPRIASSWLGASRLLGWFVVVAGGVLLVGRIAASANPNAQWTTLVVWTAAWVIGWRLAAPQREADDGRPTAVSRAIPDREFAMALVIAVLIETILFTLSERQSNQIDGIADPLLWLRVAAYLAVSASTLVRASHQHVWTIAMATLVATTSLVSVQVAIHFDATANQRLMWAMLPAAFTIAFISHWLPMIAGLVRRIAGGSAAVHLGRLVESSWKISLAIAMLGGFSATTMIMIDAPTAEIQLTIVAIALAAWSIAEMAEASDSSRFRHAAVTVALTSIGFWASVDSGETSHPLLSASMRWLVASVFAMPMVLFVFPKLLGQRLAASWNDAFRRGAVIAGVAAGCSLVSMLVMEALIRSEGGIDEISWTLVIGVAVTLAILSALAGLVGIFSGPGFELRERLKLSDQQRVQLIIAAQVIGAIAWLHVVLCKNWTLFGLRNYWPYIVMVLAFVSVGVTEWARRRKDEVMSQTLSHTALYLPLIPVIGFWMSGWFEEFSWEFAGGRARYDLLLAIGSVYYIGVSALWKGTVPRISAIVLGNAAWWVVLAQQPSWSFLMHPQIWLIPPAVCVLIAVHLYRDRLDVKTASAVRYASTLVIYISSTADLMLQQIGTNIWGPIVLVSLALAGMASGVVLRVRPFLYLGAMFVFLGVASMVWHAQAAIDAVWPWWVFGITAGILLLVGLMAIEKNKPRLREYANNLATWQG